MPKWAILFVFIGFLANSMKILFEADEKGEDHGRWESNADIKSAIKRAKTVHCKQEFERSYLHDLQNQPTKLQRTCPRDDHSQKQYSLVGCQLGQAQNFTYDRIVDSSGTNPNECLDSCFSFGYRYAGVPQNDPRQCLCSQTIVHDIIKECNKKSGSDKVRWHELDFGIYGMRNASHSELPSANNFSQPVKIAFLMILNGRSESQIIRLFEKIYSADHLYYIHVDRRDNYLFEKLLILEKTYQNVMLARDRYATIWGGTDLLAMILNSMKRLADMDWDYLINLSGSDYTLKGIDELRSYLSNRNRESIYMRSHNLKGHDFIKKQALDQYFLQCEDRSWRLGPRKLPNGIIYTGGSDWFALPRSFCDHITDSLMRSDPLVKPLHDIYMRSLLPAESFFHTVALNGIFCDKLIQTNNLRVTNWNRKRGCKCQHKDVVDWCGCSPSIYVRSDWKRIKQLANNPSIFFTRKFDPKVSSSILDLIDNLKQPGKDRECSNKPSTYRESIWSREFDPSDQVLELFSQRAIRLAVSNQVISQRHDPVDDSKVETIEIYFESDRFVGWIVNYCNRIAKDCHEILVRQRDNLHDAYNCSTNAGYHLIKIEINHGFDKSERIFRNLKPLDTNSDIIAYHKWCPNEKQKPSLETLDNVNQTISFIWTNRMSGKAYRQDAVIKFPSKPNDLSFAHRMNIKQPLEPGLWFLELISSSSKCLTSFFFVTGNAEETPNEELLMVKAYDAVYEVRNMTSNID